MLIPLDRHAYIRTVYNCAGTAHLCTCRECTGAQEGALLKNGILNPAINSLISRVRHTNTLVIADRGFPYWPQLETVDISLVDDMPRVLDVLQALLPNFSCGRVYIAEEFEEHNGANALENLKAALGDIEVIRLPHAELKKLVPSATGLIRTGDTLHYANIILESA